jgi:hypothetical protein
MDAARWVLGENYNPRNAISCDMAGLAGAVNRACNVCCARCCENSPPTYLEMTQFANNLVDLQIKTLTAFKK